ncbi:inositol monophosphatase family protein [Pseudogracilibacillus auburnensis]|uniref:Inositol-1-monophosphatase n=1 Tax=Pseudogracilibacillus auburnensis TaxID=1494959 RepID=A0A2V3WAD6_9BACI|nr:inositol monophosphatase family protein [Pseudogracilibacillus auburnensis]MBO1001964.1 inositol monophosphatase [Pseudogracilibacillus auburnensis]PXW90188.1 myo-inositol-1(or 4)-monophosphatase [Pseudogracilibacillus auburnensis]
MNKVKNPVATDLYFKEAKHVILTAGESVRNEIFQKKIIHTKENFTDLVTNVDREVESYLIKHLIKLIPDSHLVTEETNATNAIAFDQQPYTWVIDPIDGTMNFVHHFPRYAISVALYHYNDIVFGLTLDIVNNILYSAIKGQGAYMNDTLIHTSTIDSLKHSLIAYGIPSAEWRATSRSKQILFSLFGECQGIRNSGSSCLDLAFVATGQLDGFWHYHLKPWDVAVGILLVEEAGGICTNFNHQISNLKDDWIIASNKPIYDEFISHIRSAADVK